MRVLLVEDDEDLSGRIAAVLRSENFVVDIARNGEDALHAGLTELFDVAILVLYAGRDRLTPLFALAPPLATVGCLALLRAHRFAPQPQPAA